MHMLECCQSDQDLNLHALAYSEVLEGSKELRIVLCRDKRSGTQHRTSVVAACGERASPSHAGATMQLAHILMAASLSHPKDVGHPRYDCVLLA